MLEAMSSALGPCPSCSRHVRVGEERCPFCGGSVSGVAAPVVRPVPRGSLTRALVFSGAALALGLSGSCGDESQAGLYGGPPPPDDRGSETAPPADGTGDSNATPDSPPPAPGPADGTEPS